MANWTFIRPQTLSALAIGTVCRRSSSCISFPSEYGGSEQAESPECTPACSMCSMTPPMITSSPSRDMSTSTSHGVVQEAVQQHRRIVGDLDRFAHVALEILLLMDDFHGPATEAHRTGGRTTSG